MKSFERSFRAISPVLAVLMMIAVAIAGSLVVYAWVMGYIGLSTEKSGQEITIQSVVNQAGDLMVYVQNTGEGTVQLDEDGCLYVNGQLVPCSITNVTVAEDVATLAKGETATLRYADGAASPGEKVKVKVTTLLGFSAEYHDYPAGTANPVPGTVKWNKTYGGTGSEWASSIVATSDGGYAIAGVTDSFGAGNYDVWLVKTDRSGNMQWSRTYGGYWDDVAYSLVKTLDGGYAIAGYTESFGNGREVYLIKTDSVGNMEWTQTYGGNETDEARSLLATADGGYAIAGSTGSFGVGESDFWLIKTDAGGNVEWNQTYGDVYDDSAYSLVATADGGYAVAGNKNNQPLPNPIILVPSLGDFWLVKTDEHGNMVWNQTYEEPITFQSCSLAVASDGGYVIAGREFLIKTNNDGNKEWTQTYGILTVLWFSYPQMPSVALVASDGGYVIAGTAGLFIPDACCWLIKTDTIGNMEWNQTYIKTGWTHGCSLVETPDGGYAVAGTTNDDFWLIKTY